MRDSRTIASGWLLSPSRIEHLLAAGAQAGIPQEVGRETLLSPLPLKVGRYRLIPDAPFCAFVGRVLDALLVQGSWLEVIAGPPERDDDALTLAMQASHDLRSAVMKACRYGAFWSTSTDLHFDAETAAVQAVSRAPDTPGRAGVMAVLIGTLARRLRVATAPGTNPVLRAELRWSPRGSAAALETVLGIPVRHGSAADRLVLDPAALDQPLPRGWHPFVRFFDREVVETIADLPGEHAARARVTSALDEHLVEGATDLLPRVARTLGLSTRSLQRQLAAEGCTFRQVLAARRMELAQTALARPTARVGDVAFALGFRDPSSFVRAFKRWTGATPGAWRQGMGLS